MPTKQKQQVKRQMKELHVKDSTDNVLVRDQKSAQGSVVSIKPSAEVSITDQQLLVGGVSSTPSLSLESSVAQSGEVSLRAGPNSNNNGVNKQAKKKIKGVDFYIEEEGTMDEDGEEVQADDSQDEGDEIGDSDDDSSPDAGLGAHASSGPPDLDALMQSPSKQKKSKITSYVASRLKPQKRIAQDQAAAQLQQEDLSDILNEFDSSRKRKIELAQTATRQDAFFRASSKALGRIAGGRGGSLAVKAVGAQDDDANKKVLIVKRKTVFGENGLPIVPDELQSPARRRNVPSTLQVARFGTKPPSPTSKRAGADMASLSPNTGSRNAVRGLPHQHGTTDGRRSDMGSRSKTGKKGNKYDDEMRDKIFDLADHDAKQGGLMDHMESRKFVSPNLRMKGGFQMSPDASGGPSSNASSHQGRRLIKSGFPSNVTVTRISSQGERSGEPVASVRRRAIIRPASPEVSPPTSPLAKTRQQVRIRNSNNEISEFLRPRVDYQRSLEIGNITYERPRGPKEGRVGEYQTRTMIADSISMEQGRIAKFIREKEIKRRIEMRKRSNQARMTLRQGAKGRNASSDSLRQLLEMRETARRKGNASKYSNTITERYKTNEPSMVRMASKEAIESPTPVSSKLEKTSSNSNQLTLSGFGFAFGQKTKKKLLEKAENEITQQEFEQFCYDAVKRVQSNNAEELKKLRDDIANVAQEGIAIDIDKDVEDFDDPHHNINKAIREYQKKQGQLEDEDTKFVPESQKLREYMDNLGVTKQERRLLNHKRFLKMWDEHEDKVKGYFFEKKEQRFGPVANRKKETKTSTSLMLIRQPHANLGKLKADEDPAGALDEDETRTERETKNLKILSLAKSIAAPRPDQPVEPFNTADFEATMQSLESAQNSDTGNDPTFPTSPQPKKKKRKGAKALARSSHGCGIEPGRVIQEDAELSPEERKQMKRVSQEARDRTEPDEYDSTANVSMAEQPDMDGVLSEDGQRKSDRARNFANKAKGQNNLLRKTWGEAEGPGDFSELLKQEQTLAKAKISKNVKTLRASDAAEKVFNQLAQRPSIMHQGEIYNRKKQLRELARVAAFDGEPTLPSQIWYDQIRASDDGSYSKVATLKEDANIDYQHKRFFDRRKDYLRKTVLTPRADGIANASLAVSPRSNAATTHRAETVTTQKIDTSIEGNSTLSSTFYIQKQGAQPIVPCAAAAGPIHRPFNSQARVTYRPGTQTILAGHNQKVSAELGLHSCHQKVQRRDEVGGPIKNGFLRSLKKLDRAKANESAAAAETTQQGGPDSIGMLSQSFDMSAMKTLTPGSLNNSMMSDARATGRRGGSLLDSKMSATIDPEKIAERREKGLKIADDFFDLLLQVPGQKQRIYDNCTRNKIPQDVEIFGKPNVLVALSGIENGSYSMNQLSHMTAEELVALIEATGEDGKSSGAYRKIFERIMQDKMENEYNRTKVEDRRGVLENALRKEKFAMNVNGTVRLLESLDNGSHVKRGSYLNNKIRENRRRANQVHAGLADRGAATVAMLQIRGRNQLVKELDECSKLVQTGPDISAGMARKIAYEEEAIHRNDTTGEVEPPGGYNEVIEEDDGKEREKMSPQQIEQIVRGQFHLHNIQSQGRQSSTQGGAGTNAAMQQAQSAYTTSPVRLESSSPASPGRDDATHRMVSPSQSGRNSIIALD